MLLSFLNSCSHCSLLVLLKLTMHEGTIKNKQKLFGKGIGLLYLNHFVGDYMENKANRQNYIKYNSEKNQSWCKNSKDI
jgi:hypothetical protein